MSHRDDALEAIEMVEKLLMADLSPLGKKLALTTLEHAKESIAALEETKRPRRKTAQV